MPTESVRQDQNPNEAPEVAHNDFMFDVAAQVLPMLRELYPPSAKPRSDARGITLGVPIDIRVDRCVLDRYSNKYVVMGHCSACDRRFITTVESHRDTGIHLPRINAKHTGVPFKLPSRDLLGVRINPASTSQLRNLGFSRKEN